MEALARRTAHLADALIHVPRYPFIPRQAWAAGTPAGAGSGATRGRWIDRDADPEVWWRAVSSDAAIYTQLDDGESPLTAENAAKTFAPTCSASSPSLVAAFLRRLGPGQGDRILEIGTGTGWTAGLLSYVTGDQKNVTTVEVDAALAAVAERNLRSVGMAPRLVVGDGTAGIPDPAATFDGVHVTCGVRDIPYRWVEQTRPGGVIVLPHAPATRLLRLTVGENGTASGSFHEVCSFMLLRAQRRPVSRLKRTEPRTRKLRTAPDPLLHAHTEPGLEVLLGDLVGDIPFATGSSGSGSGSGSGDAGLLSSGTSLATVEAGRVTQTGPRDLWDEAEEVYRGWKERGSPGLDRIGFTVTRSRQYVWLDDPTVSAAQTMGFTKGSEHG
ncbi:methyltransferase domain-containing protein [Streptomyces paludis]|uniref:methyltransferase domain-containing protein n=1 Tax=Streptomyces paludis TaxID=2282738 RepID=UPI0013B4521D|nr:methyltransferase domain-containing protein [Streptomyces paludis]